MNGLNERTKRQIALMASDDLEEDEISETRDLLEKCPDCRRYWVRVRGCMDIIERTVAAPDSRVESDLWPGIESRLRAAAPARPREFNGWLPALSMAAACILILVAGQMDATWHQEGNWPGPSDQLASGMRDSGWMPIPQGPPRYSPFAPSTSPTPRMWSAAFGTESGPAWHVVPPEDKNAVLDQSYMRDNTDADF